MDEKEEGKNKYHAIILIVAFYINKFLFAIGNSISFASFSQVKALELLPIFIISISWCQMINLDKNQKKKYKNTHIHSQTEKNVNNKIPIAVKMEVNLV